MAKILDELAAGALDRDEPGLDRDLDCIRLPTTSVNRRREKDQTQQIPRCGSPRAGTGQDVFKSSPIEPLPEFPVHLSGGSFVVVVVGFPISSVALLWGQCTFRCDSCSN